MKWLGMEERMMEFKMLVSGLIGVLGLIYVVCEGLERRMWEKRVSKRREKYMSKRWMIKKGYWEEGC